MVFSEEEQKIRTKKNIWKYRGLLWDTQEEIDEIYERYLNSERCEKKGCEYTKKNWKCMDHEHKNGKYGKFRGILCNACNLNTDRQDNICGVSNVHWNNSDKKWVYTKMINGKRHIKRFPYFIQAVIYKKEYEEKVVIDII